MNKYELFCDFFERLVDDIEVPNEVSEVYDMIKAMGEKESNKPLFTDSGLEILEYLQESGVEKAKAKDIAEGMSVSSRKVSGAIRKLVTDGFVDKFGSNPVVYSLTEKGKNFDISSYKGE